MNIPLIKDIFREIRKSAGRFISITLLLVLSVGFYSGLRATQPDMRITADRYMDDSGMFDLRVQSGLGMSGADLEAIRALPGVLDAEGGYTIDAVIRAPDSDIIVSLQTMTERGINTPELLSGRLPESADECLVENRFLQRMGLSVGDRVDISRVSDVMDDALAIRSFTITGTVRSPLYMSNVQRGVSTLDSGRVSYYAIIPRGAVSLDFYTEISAVIGGAKDAMAYTGAYDSIADHVINTAKELGETRAPLRRDELTAQAREDIAEAEREIAEKSAELEDARRKLEEGRAEYEDGMQKLADARAEIDEKFAGAEAELAEAERQVQDGEAQLAAAQRELNARAAEGKAELDAALAELDAGAELLAAAWDAYHAALAELEAGIAQWNALPDFLRSAMPNKEAELEAGKAALSETLAQLNARQAELDAGYADYQQGLEAYEAETSSARRRLSAERARITDAKSAVQEGRAELEAEREAAQSEVADLERELKDAIITIEDSERELAEGEEKLLDAQQNIADARATIDDVAPGEWYVQGRDSNYGYASFGQDADRMGALGHIFPIIFFAVAALVCLTTMTRMVDEQRIEIGTFKSLGMHHAAVAGKFIVYSGLACVIGVTIGLCLGMTILPKFIFHAYSILYDMPPIITPFLFGTVVASTLAAFVCTLGATMISCAAALRETPASLLRPRAPKPGKRVFLEYITPLWSRMSFFGKVSARNVLRYKKRLIMSVTGIAGCTALIVTGLGLRDSIVALPRLQFEELYKYDLLITVNDGADTAELRETLTGSPLAADYGLIRSVPADFSAGAQAYAGDITVPESPGALDPLITLRNASGGDALTLSDDGAVISAKLAELLGLSAGDTMTIDTGERHDVTVAAIAEQYVNHVVYMSPDYYERVMRERYSPNRALIVCTDGTEETSGALSAELLGLSAVGHAVYFKTEVDGFTRSIGSINSVVMIIILAAAALALIVLFNLTNINITERRRELATIKVLGFYDSEVTWYIIRENTYLTIAAIAVGLFGGKLLHNWLIRTVEVDFTMFKRSVEWHSYVIAAVLTVLFAVIVNIAGHLRMKRINMVESLKINE